MLQGFGIDPTRSNPTTLSNQVLARYVSFQLEYATPPILNIGCGNNPCGWYGPDCTHFDIDVWNYPNFVQGDAHNLPFPDDSFVTAVMGDMLEHVRDPVRVLQEAGRVAPCVVMTTFEEWRLGGPGYQPEGGKALYFPEGVELDHPEGLVSRTSEEVTPHHGHIWQWDRAYLGEIIERSGLKILVEEEACPGIHEGHAMKNFCFVLKR